MENGLSSSLARINGMDGARERTQVGIMIDENWSASVKGVLPHLDHLEQLAYSANIFHPIKMPNRENGQSNVVNMITYLD